MQLKHAMSIADLRRMALRNVPRVFTDYMEAGSYSEHTRDANVADMRAIKLRQRVLVDMSQRNLATTVLGEPLAMPLALAPTGLAGMQYADGEILACRAAHAAGIQYCQSTMSICSIEDIGAAVTKPWWFQLYVMRDRGFVEALIKRAEVAGCSALFLTVDLPVNGQRHIDMRNGLSVPPRLTARTVFDVLTPSGLGLAHPQRQAQDLRQCRWPSARRQRLRRADARRMDAQPVRRHGDVEGRGLDPLDLATETRAQGHPRSGGCARGAEDRRRRHRGVEPWWPPA